MATRLISCRHRTTEVEQALPDRALAFGYFPDWEPIDPADAAHVDALKPPPVEPETPESPALEPAVEPAAPAPTRKSKAADAGHDTTKE